MPRQHSPRPSQTPRPSPERTTSRKRSRKHHDDSPTPVSPRPQALTTSLDQMARRVSDEEVLINAMDVWHHVYLHSHLLMQDPVRQLRKECKDLDSQWARLSRGKEHMVGVKNMDNFLSKTDILDYGLEDDFVQRYNLCVLVHSTFMPVLDDKRCFKGLRGYVQMFQKVLQDHASMPGEDKGVMWRTVLQMTCLVMALSVQNGRKISECQPKDIINAAWGTDGTPHDDSPAMIQDAAEQFMRDIATHAAKDDKRLYGLYQSTLNLLLQQLWVLAQSLEDPVDTGLLKKIMSERKKLTVSDDYDSEALAGLDPHWFEKGSAEELGGNFDGDEDGDSKANDDDKDLDKDFQADDEQEDGISAEERRGAPCPPYHEQEEGLWSQEHRPSSFPTPENSDYINDGFQKNTDVEDEKETEVLTEMSLDNPLVREHEPKKAFPRSAGQSGDDNFSQAVNAEEDAVAQEEEYLAEESTSTGEKRKRLESDEEVFEDARSTWSMTETEDELLSRRNSSLSNRAGHEGGVHGQRVESNALRPIAQDTEPRQESAERLEDEIQRLEDRCEALPDHAHHHEDELHHEHQSSEPQRLSVEVLSDDSLSLDLDVDGPPRLQSWLAEQLELATRSPSATSNQDEDRMHDSDALGGHRPLRTLDKGKGRKMSPTPTPPSDNEALGLADLLIMSQSRDVGDLLEYVPSRSASAAFPTRTVAQEAASTSEALRAKSAPRRLKAQRTTSAAAVKPESWLDRAGHILGTPVIRAKSPAASFFEDDDDNLPDLAPRPTRFASWTPSPIRDDFTPSPSLSPHPLANLDAIPIGSSRANSGSSSNPHGTVSLGVGNEADVANGSGTPGKKLRKPVRHWTAVEVDRLMELAPMFQVKAPAAENVTPDRRFRKVRWSELKRFDEMNGDLLRHRTQVMLKDKYRDKTDQGNHRNLVREINNARREKVPRFTFPPLDQRPL